MYNKNDLSKEALPADLNFLEPDDDDFDFLVKHTNLDHKIERIKSDDDNIAEIIARRKVRRKNFNNKFFR